MNTAEHARLLTRIRAEYLEMPGMSLRLEQVARLSGLEPATCKLLLDELVDAKFLGITSDGGFARLTADITHRGRAARASRESTDAVRVRTRAS